MEAAVRAVRAVRAAVVEGNRILLPSAPDVLLAYSGGKDSLACMDVCISAGRRVEAFFMYFLPGMDLTEYLCGYAEQRYGITVHRVQHWMLSAMLRSGTFRLVPSLSTPRIRLVDVERYVRGKSGMEWIAYGYRCADSVQRNAMIKSGTLEKSRRCAPIQSWQTRDVLAYLSRRHIEIVGSMASAGRRSSGIDLSPTCLEWLRQNWPSDYKKIIGVFPLAEAQAARAGEIRERRPKNTVSAI